MQMVCDEDDRLVEMRRCVLAGEIHTAEAMKSLTCWVHIKNPRMKRCKVADVASR